jgi:signal transduction histidine kinase
VLTRDATLPVFWVVLAAGAVLSATGVLGGTAVLAAFPLYAVAGRHPPRTAAVALTAALAVVALGVVPLPGLAGTGTAGGTVVPAAAVVVAAWALGIAKRNHREKAVTEERLRLARELHDVISHGLGAITVHAGVARQVRPDEVPALIAAIEESARDGTRDLRRLLDALRGTERQPPTLDEVLAGVPVPATVDVRGRRRSLPVTVEETAFRVVREALTNVAKHARGATAAVVLDYRPDELLVEITDNGAGGPVTAGHGITGMRERVAACGGTLTVTAEEHGVRVAAVLPTGGSR